MTVVDKLVLAWAILATVASGIEGIALWMLSDTRRDRRRATTWTVVTRADDGGEPGTVEVCLYQRGWSYSTRDQTVVIAKLKTASPTWSEDLAEAEYTARERATRLNAVAA